MAKKVTPPKDGPSSAIAQREADGKPDAPKPPLPESLRKALPAAGQIVALSDQIKNLTWSGKASDPGGPLWVELDAAKKKGAIALARAFVVFHRAMERLADDLKPLKALYEQYKEVAVPAIFEEDGVTSIPLDEGFRVGTSYTFRASIRPDQKDEAYAWLRSANLGDIITSTVNSSTLAKTAKELAEENKELPDALFNVARMPNTSVTQTKG